MWTPKEDQRLGGWNSFQFTLQCFRQGCSKRFNDKKTKRHGTEKHCFFADPNRVSRKQTVVRQIRTGLCKFAEPELWFQRHRSTHGWDMNWVKLPFVMLFRLPRFDLPLSNRFPHSRFTQRLASWPVLWFEARFDVNVRVEIGLKSVHQIDQVQADQSRVFLKLPAAVCVFLMHRSPGGFRCWWLRHRCWWKIHIFRQGHLEERDPFEEVCILSEMLATWHGVC